MQAYVWKFSQLGGTKKTLTLTGWNAPFGRPRRGALVEDGIELRSAEVFYPGNDQPTILLFGTKLDDLQLNGRWSDQFNGPGGAIALAATFKAWVRDQQVVQVDWGPFLSVRGVFQKFTPSREADSEIAWKLNVRVLEDLFAGSQGSVPTTISPGDYSDQVLQALNGIPTLPDLPELSGSFLDLIDDLVTDVATFTGAFVDIANQIDSLEQAAFGEIARFRGAINQLQTAVIQLRSTIDSASNQATMLRDSGNAQISYGAYRTAAAVDTYVALALLADADSKAEVAQKGTNATTYTVQSGDTWESIATNLFGGASKADVLRQANGARYGSQPVVGSTIHVPLNVAA